MRGWGYDGKRVVMGIVSGISIIFCVALAGMWIRSEYRADIIEYSLVTSVQSPPAKKYRYVFTMSNDGRFIIDVIWVDYADDVFIAPSAYRPLKWEAKPSVRIPAEDWLSRDWHLRLPIGKENQEITIGMPYWAAVLLAGLVPAMVVYRQMSRRGAVAAGHCARCGYDLRETPERCPECGTVVS